MALKDRGVNLQKSQISILTCDMVDKFWYDSVTIKFKALILYVSLKRIIIKHKNNQLLEKNHLLPYICLKKNKISTARVRNFFNGDYYMVVSVIITHVTRQKAVFVTFEGWPPCCSRSNTGQFLKATGLKTISLCRVLILLSFGIQMSWIH